MQDLTAKLDGAGPPNGQLPAAEFIQIPEEMQAIIQGLGITLDSADGTQMASAIAMMCGASDYFTGAGTANAQTLTTVAPKEEIRSYITGGRVRWLPSNANTSGTVVIDVDGVGSKSLVAEDGVSSIGIGNLNTVRYAEAVYDGTNYRLLNRSLAASGVTPLPRGSFSGGLLTYISANDFDIGPTACRDQANTLNGISSTTFRKQFDNNFALGTAAGAFPSTGATRALDKDFYLFMIMKDTGAIDFGVDDDPDAVNLLIDAVSLGGAGWTGYLHIGWIRTDGITNTVITKWTHSLGDPDYFRWEVPPVVSISSWTTSATTRLGGAPPLTSADMNHNYDWDSGSTTTVYVMVSPFTANSIIPNATKHTFVIFRNNLSSAEMVGDAQIRVELDASSNYRWKASISSAGTVTILISTRGYFFRRGAK